MTYGHGDVKLERSCTSGYIGERIQSWGWRFTECRKVKSKLYNEKKKYIKIKFIITRKKLYQTKEYIYISKVHTILSLCELFIFKKYSFFVVMLTFLGQYFFSLIILVPHVPLNPFFTSTLHINQLIHIMFVYECVCK